MASYKKIQNRLHRIKVEIMEIEESIKRAEKIGKVHLQTGLGL